MNDSFITDLVNDQRTPIALANWSEWTGNCGVALFRIDAGGLGSNQAITLADTRTTIAPVTTVQAEKTSLLLLLLAIGAVAVIIIAK
jgi:hypothetical protein